MGSGRCFALAGVLMSLACTGCAYNDGNGNDAVAFFQHVLRSAEAVGAKTSSQTLAAEPPLLTGEPPMYLSGDGAEVFVETGSFANSWVPCTILKIPANGWYDVRVMAGQKGQNYTDISGIRPNYLRQVVAEDYNSALVAFVANPNAADLAMQLVREANRRKRAVKALKKARDFAKDVMSKGCPGEYIVSEGNIRGMDHYGRGGRNLQPTVELCATAGLRQPRGLQSLRVGPSFHGLCPEEVCHPTQKLRGRSFHVVPAL